MPTVARSLIIPLEGTLPAPLMGLLPTFRLLVNEILREALSTNATSRATLSRFARDRAFVHHLTGTYGVVASSIALSLAHAHRRRLRNGIPCRVPFVRRPFLRVDDASFHLDPVPQRVRLSLHNGVWTSFAIRLSDYHRGVLATPGIRLKQLHVTGEGVVLFYERPVPQPYAPRALLGLDTNERSLDGVCVTSAATRAATIPFPEIAVIQQRHVDRRRKLARKKSNDRRVMRGLTRREGRREHDRVRSRLHVLSKHLVEVAHAHRAALALEDLSKLVQPRKKWGRPAGRRPGAIRSPKLRRRLSSWPRAELHRQLEYKAAHLGVPIVWVNPYRTSVTCPRCGAYGGPRRTGPTFDCPACGWRLDRQLNAGVNIGRIALRETAELGGLRLDLDALAHDAVTPRYPFQRMGRARAERMAREGASSRGRQLRLLSN